jgi:eukaryotic-like serine/threonine-protein kinase
VGARIWATIRARRDLGPPPRKAPEPGYEVDLKGRTLLGKYEIEGMLGQGGMGAVWRARHALTGRRLAIKTLDEGYLENQAVVQRFGREARAASACQHPGIVEVLDLDQTEEGIPFLVMEFLEGETLARRIERRGRLDQAELVRIGAMLLEALDAAHAHGIIHRDLKPENIYVVPAGRRGEIVKILDFGISHKSDEAGEKLTMTGSVLGTPHYMSPEQAMGEAELDHRADLYAAGVVLYECAVGDVPFDAPNYNKLLRTILDQPPVPPRRRGADISDEVERVILWAMDKERDRRMASAAQFQSWLERAAAGEQPPYEVGKTPAWAVSSPRSPSAPVHTPAGSLPTTPGGGLGLAPQSSLSQTLGDGDLGAVPWRPSPFPLEAPLPSSVPPSSSASLELDLDDPIKGPTSAELAMSLEIDESAMRPRSTPPPPRPAGVVPAAPRSATASTPGMIASPLGIAPQTRTASGQYPVAPRISEVGARFEPPRAEVAEAPAPWKRQAMWAVAGVLVFFGLVVTVRFVVRPGVDDAQIEGSIEGPAQGDRRPEDRVRTPRWVTVRIAGLPPSAHIVLDGLPAQSPVRVRRGGEHVLEISAPGYESRRIVFTSDENRTVDADLRPAEGFGQPVP